MGTTDKTLFLAVIWTTLRGTVAFINSIMMLVWLEQTRLNDACYCSRYEVGRKRARNKVTGERDKLKHKVKREMKVGVCRTYSSAYSQLMYVRMSS